MKTSQNRERGFTLIELSVALVVIGIVAIFLAPKITNIFDKTRGELANQEILTLVTAAVAFRNITGNYTGLGAAAGGGGLKILADGGYFIAPFTDNAEPENAYGASTTLATASAGAAANLVYTTDTAAQCEQLEARLTGNNQMGEVTSAACTGTGPATLTVVLN